MSKLSTLTLGSLTAISAAAVTTPGATGGHGLKVSTILLLSNLCLRYLFNRLHIPKYAFSMGTLVWEVSQMLLKLGM